MNKTVLGVNIPWWNGSYCHDLGITHLHPDWPSTFDRELVSECFDYLNELGIKVFRFWLFEGGEGLNFDERGQLTGLDKTFVENLTIQTDLAQQHGLAIYYTFFDANSVYRNEDFITDSVIGNAKNIRAFCDIVLPATLSIIAPTIWAIDLCNEPEAIISGPEGNYSDKGYGWQQVMSNMKELILAIRKIDPGIKIAIGSGFQEERSLLRGKYFSIGFDLDFMDFHTHRTDGFVPQLESILQYTGKKEIVLGELSACEKLGEHPSRIEWRKNQNLIFEKLCSLETENYKAVFLWRMNPTSPEHYNEQPDTLIFRSEKSRLLEYIKNRAG